MIDNKTERLSLPLPNVDNYLEDDVARLADALLILDEKVATVGDDGKVPVDQLPAVAITDTFPVASQEAMLSLTAQPGDVAIRSDVSKSFILMSAPASVLGNWKELLNNGYIQAKDAISRFSGNLTEEPSWDEVPSHSDTDLATPLNAQAQVLSDRTVLLRANVSESLRRSYADVGYNVVGYFEDGFTFVNTNDVGIHAATGKGYTGPVGQVAAGTDPLSPGFTDRSLVKERVSILDFGAVPGGAVDISAAVRLAVNHIKSLRQQSSFAGAVASGTQPYLYFPYAKYKVDDYLTDDIAAGSVYFDVVGEGAILEMADGVVSFGGIGYNCTISDIKFRGGSKALSIKTNNIDTTIINLLHCEFINQSDYHITTDGNSASTILNIDKSKFVKTLTTGGSFDFESGDLVNITDSWITANSSQAVIINKAAHLNFHNVLGVPLENLASNGRWIDNYRSLSAKGSRFGGEFAGAPIVYNYTTYSTTFPYIGHSVSFDDCQLYCNSTGVRDDSGVLVAITGLPSSFSVNDCRGVVDSNVICDKIPGGMVAYLDAYDAAANKSTLEFNIGTNSLRSDPLHRSDVALRNRLAKYGVVQRATGLTVQQVTAKNIVTEKVTPLAISNFTVAGLVSNIDTGIFKSTDNIGYKSASVYDVFVSANPAPGGSSEYRSVCVGKVIVSTGFLAGTIRQFISYVDIASRGGGDVPALTTTAVFFDGTTESSNCPNGSLIHQIRLKVSGFSGTAGSGLSAGIMKSM